MTLWACRVVTNHSALRTSRRRVPLKRSLYPFNLKSLQLERFLDGLIPGRARIDVNRLNADFSEPVFEGFGCKLRAIIRADIFGFAAVEQ